jgi:hypothetical protein
VVSQLLTVKIKGSGFELLILIVNVTSSLSSTQEVISRVQVTETNSARIYLTTHP